MKLQSPLFLAPLALGFTGAIWLLFRTLRRQASIAEPGTNPYETGGSQRFLYCVWHDSMVIPVFGGRHCHTSALTSQHADGSFVAQVLRFRNISAVRGSTNRITTGAIRDLMQRAENQHIVITPDGPRGPARTMSSGIAYLASRTGRAIVPTAFACSRYWRWKGSWSDLIIPKPFAKVVLRVGTPIHIPAQLTSEQLGAYVAEIQQRMDRLNEAAQSELRPNAPAEGRRLLRRPKSKSRNREGISAG